MATSVVFPRVQFFANNGRPLIGGRIHTYVAGSSTRAPTYKDAARAQPNANPIILDGRGEASIYLDIGVEYKFVIEDSKGALLFTQEPVYGAIWPDAASWPSDATLAYQYMLEAKAAAGAIGPIKFCDTYAQALADITNIPVDGLIEIARDETHAGARTRYFKRAGDVLEFAVNLDQLRIDLSAAGGADMVEYDNGTVQDVLDGTKTMQSYAELRSYNGRAFSVSITSPGAEGVFIRRGTLGLADNGGTIIVDAAGRAWERVFDGDVGVRWFGAKGDKVTDDTAAITMAFAAQKLGGTFVIPHARGDAYAVSRQGENSCVFDYSRVMNILGDGMYSALQPTVGTAVNTILIKPDPAIANICSKWEGLALGDPYTGTRAGLNGIYLDTTVAGSNLAKAVFSRLNILAGTGAALLHVNLPTSNVNGGMYACSIENSVLKGGINLQATGDSNTAHKNLISGPNVGIYLGNTAGASLFTAVDNNITSTGGAFKVDAGSRFKFLRNNCEQITSFTGGAAHMCDIAGGNGTISTPEIRGNHFGLFSGIANSGVIRLSNTIGALVSENVILNANPAGVGIVVDANNLNARIGPNTYGTGVAAKVIDNGVGTMGVIKVISGFVNAWEPSPAAPTSTPRFYKDILGTVRLHGKLASGTVTPGTTMFTLPTGFCPDQTCEFMVVTYHGATLTPGHIRVNTDGTVQIIAGQNTELHLDGIAFPAAGLADSISDL